MKIYEVHVNYKKYSDIYVDTEACKKIPGNENLDGYDCLIRFGGELVENWWPRIVRPCPNNRGRCKPVGDFTAVLGTGDWLLERQAYEKLKNVLGKVQLLPINFVDCGCGDYVAVNVLTFLDCLDLDNSEYKAFDLREDDAYLRIYEVKKYAFFTDVIESHHCFKIANKQYSFVYVTEEFVEEVKKHKITGFDFKLIWEG